MLFLEGSLQSKLINNNSLTVHSCSHSQPHKERPWHFCKPRGTQLCSERASTREIEICAYIWKEPRDADGADSTDSLQEMATNRVNRLAFVTFFFLLSPHHVTGQQERSPLAMQLRQQRDKILLEAKDYREKPATHAGTSTRPDAAIQVAELTDPILREQESEAAKPPPPPLAETLRRDVISTAVAFLHNPALAKVRDCAATSYCANRVCDAPFAVHDCTLVECCGAV